MVEALLTTVLDSNSSNSEQTTSSEASHFNNMEAGGFRHRVSHFNHMNMDSYSNAKATMEDTTRAFPKLNSKDFNNTYRQIDTNAAMPGSPYHPINWSLFVEL